MLKRRDFLKGLIVCGGLITCKNTTFEAYITGKKRTHALMSKILQVVTRSQDLLLKTLLLVLTIALHLNLH